jgi:hypothetical protein
MGYNITEISDILLKADKTLYRLGAIAYNDMFSEESETLDYERDIIYIYKKSVEYADNFYVGTLKLDQVVERLSVKVSLYDYGKLTPIYSDIVFNTSLSQATPYVLKSTILDLGLGLTGSSNFEGTTVEIDLNFAYIKTQVRENYIHDQQVASTTWIVNHNMNKYPSVNVVDTANDEVTGDVKYNSLNQITISFTAAFSGKAYLN